MAWGAAWEVWVPGALAFAGLLGPSLLARGRASRSLARGVALAALVALLVVLVVEAWGARRASVVFDLVLAAALVAIGAVGTHRAWAWSLVVLAALASARGIALVPMAMAVRAFLGVGIFGACAWLGAALLALVLAVIRLRASRRSIPAGRSRAGFRRS